MDHKAMLEADRRVSFALGKLPGESIRDAAARVLVQSTCPTQRAVAQAIVDGEGWPAMFKAAEIATPAPLS